MKPSRIDGLEIPAVGGAATRSAAPPAFRPEIVRSLRQHGPLALSVGTVVFALVVLLAMTRKPMYKAESLTYVEPLVTRSVDDGTPGVYDPSRYDSYLQQQIQTATRPDILEQAINTLPMGVWRQPGEDIHAAAARLAGSLKVQREGQGYQLSISLMDPNPRKAAEVVNAATTTFLEQGRHDETVVQDGRLQLLKEEKSRIEAELAADQKEQTQLGQQLGVADPAGQLGNPYDAQLASIREELVSARQAHDVAAAQLASIASRKDPEGASAVADDTIASDASVTALKQTITQRRALLANQMAGLTPANPVYKQDQQEIAQLDKQLDARVAQIRDTAEKRLEDKLRLDLERTGDVEARLNGQLAQQTSLAHTAAPRLQRATELAADITRLENRYTAVDGAIRALSLDAHGPGTAHLVVAASVPTKPEPNKQFLLFVVALPLAILSGIGAAVFARKRDPHLYTEGDVEEQIGFLPMVSMPALDEVSRVAAEEYLLRMAAALERAYRVGRARTFVFTAASSGTDVSGFVHALRLKLIGLGFKTQAVSADEALLGQGAANLPAPVRPGLQDGLAAASLDRLKSSFDIILLEARPLIHSAEAEYAVRTADATILVVESAVTTQAELRDCAVLLQRVKADGVGVALIGLHRNVAGAEMRASIAEADRRGSKRIAPEDSAPPRQLEHRVYDMMERRARTEAQNSVRGEAGKLGMVEPKRAPDEIQAPYDARTSSFPHEEQDGVPYVECVTAAGAHVTPSTLSCSVSSASTREVPMRDETNDLRKSLAQVEFNDNNLADDLPDGSPAVGRSFFRFFERRQEEETPAVVGSEIERAFDRVLKRPDPAPLRRQGAGSSQGGDREPVSQLPQHYVPSDPAPSSASEMQGLTAAEPMQPAWSYDSVPPRLSENPKFQEPASIWQSSEPAHAPAGSLVAAVEPAQEQDYVPATAQWPTFDSPRVSVPPVALQSAEELPARFSYGSYASADGVEAVPPAPPMATHASDFPDPQVTPFARERARPAVSTPWSVPAMAVSLHDSGEFRRVDIPEVTPDPLRSELLPAHATTPDPAGAMYVLRDEIASSAAVMASSSDVRVAEPMTISSARSSAAAAAQRLAAKMAAELPAMPEAAPFQRREAIANPRANVSPRSLETASTFLAAPDLPVASAAASPVPPAAAEATHEDMPGWLSSAEAERIRQLLARFSDGVARSQAEEPVASWFVTAPMSEPAPEAPHTGQLYPAATFAAPSSAVEPLDGDSALPHSAEFATARQPTEAEIRFGFAPVATLPSARHEADAPSTTVVSPPVEPLEAEPVQLRSVSSESAAALRAEVSDSRVGEPLIAEAAAETEEGAGGLQWPSWPSLSRHITPLPSDHEEAAAKPWYETFEDHFRESSRKDGERTWAAPAPVSEPAAAASSVPNGPALPSAFATQETFGGQPLTAAEPLPLATSYAGSVAGPVAVTVAPQPAEAAPATARQEVPQELFTAPVVIQVPEHSMQPVIEAVSSASTHAVLPTNPISTLYGSHAPSVVSRASAEAVLARTLPQAPARSLEESGPLYFHEALPAKISQREEPGETMHFNGNAYAPFLSEASAPNGSLPNGNNGHGTAINAVAPSTSGHQRLVESRPYEPLEAETQFEAPVPWKTRKPPVSAAHAPEGSDLTPRPGRWGMLSRFDPHTANGDLLGPAASRRDDPEEEPQRKASAR